MRHIVGKLSTSSFQRYKVCANRSSDEGVMAPGSRGVGAVFVHSSDADSGQTGNAIGEPRVPRRSRSHYLSNAPGLADQLVASRKDSAREGGSCAAYFCKVPDLRESELGLVRYGPASRVHRGVFGPFEGSFPIGIPAGPDKFLAIREFHVVHGCVLLSNVPGLADQLVASQEDSVRKRGNVGEEIPELSAKPYFALHRGEFGFVRYDLANGGRRNVPYAKGGGQFDPVFGLVNGPVKPLVKLGQPWSNLVKILRTLRNVSRNTFGGFLGKADPSRAGNSSVKPRSNFGQPSQTSQTWSTLVKLGQTLGNVSRTFFLGVFDAASPRRIRPAWFGLSRFARRHPRKSRGTLIDDQSSPTRPIAEIGWFQRLESQNRLRGSDLGTTSCKSGTNRPGPPRSRNEICDSGPNRSGPPSPRNGDELGTNRPGPPRSRNEICDSGPNRSGPPSPRNGDELGTNRPSPSRSRNEICDSGPNRSGPPSPRNGDELGTNRPSPSRSRNEICDSGPNRSGPPSPRNGDELGTNRPGPSRSRNEICDSGPNRSGPPSPRNGDELGTNRPGPPRSRNEICDSGPNRSGPPSPRNGDELGTNRPGPPSGSGGHRRSDRLAKGKAVAYAPESSPDTDDEYDAMEDVRTRVDASLARDLQAEFDAEATGPASSTIRPPPRPGVVIGRSARPSETTRPSPQPGVTTGPSDAPSAAPRRPHTRSTGIPPSRLKRQRTEGIPDSAGTIPEDYVAPGFRYPPHGGIRPRYPVAVEISDTPLLTNLLAHPSSLVRRCQEPPDSAGPSIPYVSVYHPAVWCFIERFFHHTGTFHLSTCEMAVLPVDWSAILGIRFGGRAPPSEPIDGFEAMEILGLADRDAIEGVRRPSVRIRHLVDVLRRDREEPPTELRYRQEYDWGALTYGFYIRGLRRYSRRESISFLGFWQFTVFWAFEHFPTFAPSRLPLASDPDFPLARRWDTSRIERMTARTLLELRMTVDCIRDADIIFQPYSAALSQRPEVFRAVALSRLRLWIRTSRSWELLLGERTVRQLGDEAVVPVDPSPLMTIEAYIPQAPSDPYIAGVSAYPSLVREDVPYQEWFERVSLGSLMSLHEVAGGRVMGGVAMDSHLIRSSGQIERLESEVLRLQLELSVSVDRHTADMDRVQGEMASMQTEATQMRRDLASRDAEVARLAAALRRLEEQLQGMGITPVTGADLSGLGQPSSSPPRDPVSRDLVL
uniref:Aminotransferase-like plant mobile domain-containing protein n=1 Tax=Fagus sylvatica TaxID=28930 RepID=A0A2N9H339_FAGSY